MTREQWFAEHTGAGAAELAKGEAYAESMGWEYTWVSDDLADPFDWDGDGPMGTEALGCVLRNAKGEVLASLWGIWDVDANYGRIVKAELALEAMDHEEADAIRTGMDHVLVGV